jgi:hypothetical protein
VPYYPPYSFRIQKISVRKRTLRNISKKTFNVKSLESDFVAIPFGQSSNLPQSYTSRMVEELQEAAANNVCAELPNCRTAELTELPNCRTNHSNRTGSELPNCRTAELTDLTELPN